MADRVRNEIYAFGKLADANIIFGLPCIRLTGLGGLTGGKVFKIWSWGISVLSHNIKLRMSYLGDQTYIIVILMSSNI